MEPLSKATGVWFACPAIARKPSHSRADRAEEKSGLETDLAARENSVSRIGPAANPTEQHRQSITADSALKGATAGLASIREWAHEPGTGHAGWLGAGRVVGRPKRRKCMGGLVMFESAVGIDRVWWSWVVHYWRGVCKPVSLYCESRHASGAAALYEALLLRGAGWSVEVWPRGWERL